MQANTGKSTKSCRDAIKQWEENNGISAAEATEVSLIAQNPPIERLDDTLNQFENATKLSLSTNVIISMVALPKLTNLKILSLGRNNIQRIRFLEDLSGSLEELWMSYNNVSNLDGLSSLQKLHTFYISNNKISDWQQIAKCAELSSLRSVVFESNPVYGSQSKEKNWPMVFKKIPQLETIDGTIVDAQVRQEAEQLD